MNKHREQLLRDLAACEAEKTDAIACRNLARVADAQKAIDSHRELLAYMDNEEEVGKMKATVDFAPGMRVRVMNRTLGGKVVEEEMATIRKIHQGDKQGVHASVEFDEEPGTIYQRWIFAKDQR